MSSAAERDGIVEQLSIRHALDKLNESCEDESQKLNENTLLEGAAQAIRRVSTIVAGHDYTLLRGLVDDDVAYTLYKNGQSLTAENRKWLGGVESSRLTHIQVHPSYVAHNMKTKKVVVPIIFVASRNDSWSFRLYPSYVIHFYFEKYLTNPDDDFLVGFLFYYRPGFLGTMDGNIILTSIDTSPSKTTTN